MGVRRERLRRALKVGKVARRSRLLKVLREIGVAGERPATPEAAREFRLALEELGTTYVKLGQLLSSRPDLLPDVYIEELTRLVDEVPPVPFAELEPVIRRSIGTSVFARIDESPLAAASSAQIHQALTTDGREVVVKVRRPGVEEQAAVDLDLLRSSADFLERRSGRAQILQLSALAEEVDVHLRAELDFTEEANNTELVGSFLEGHPDLLVPKVVHPYVTEEVLVLEHIEGRKVAGDRGLDDERAAYLAREFFRAYVRQVAAEGVYHADPHRGNVLLTPDGRLALLDFGLLGRLDDDTRSTIAQLLLAIAQNRGDDVAALIFSLSHTTLESDEPGFVAELRRKLPRYHWRPLSGIRAGEALADLQRMSVKYAIRLPTSFALVGKTLAQADSIARTLDPTMDPIELLRADALELMLSEGGEAARADRVRELRLHAARAARAAAAAHRAGRGPARGRDASHRHHSGEPRGARRRDALGREPDRRRGHRRRAAARLGVDGASERNVVGRRIRGGLRTRPLHALEDLAHSRVFVGEGARSSKCGSNT
ncbi:MAG TPA: AarF/UbiB family protein [Gaiellaceae bacterium]|nr:AarF/UbiB family protein [Gaiellaceae bacterium]